MSSKVFFVFIFLMHLFVVSAQQNDAGAWTAITLNYALNKKTDISLSPEIRLNENMSEISSTFVDIGVQRALKKGFGIAGTYRITNQKQENNNYELRNRFMLDISYKHKLIKRTTLKLRTRFQSQVNGISNAENWSTPSHVIRFRAGLGYSVNKKITLDFSNELFNTFENKNFIFRQNRTILSSGYTLNKRSEIGLGLIFQQEYNTTNSTRSFVVACNYTHNFYPKKKKKEDK